MFPSLQPLTSPKDVHGRCSEQCLKPELFAANVACMAYFTHPYSLSNGTFYTGSLGIHRSELWSQLTCSGLMKSPIGLFVGLQDQHACPDCACTDHGKDRPDRPRCRKSHSNKRFAMPIGKHLLLR